MGNNYNTSYSLLGRALQNDEDAWREVSANYRDFIYYILRKKNVSPSDMDDVAQLVMTDLFKMLQSFDASKGRFRPWFSRLILNKAIEHYRKINSQSAKIENYKNNLSFVEEVEEAEVNALIQDEWISYITELALSRVRKSYRGQAIEAFTLSLKGVSADDIALQLNLSKQSVYSYRKRVKASMTVEIQKLLADLESINGNVHA